MNAVRGRGWLTVLGFGLIAVAIPFLANYRFILNHFYTEGAYLLDSGWFAAVMWRNDLLLSNPSAIGPTSYLNTHVAPIFFLTSAISWLLPLGMVEFFALFQGITYAGFAAATYYLLVTEFKLASVAGSAIACLLGLVFSFSGLIQDTIGYPHYEIAIATSLIFFLCFWIQQRYRWATAAFVLCLLMREDAGFHIVAILALVVLVRWLRGKPIQTQRETMIYLAIAFLYSIAAILVQKTVFPSDSAFTRIYLGEPAFAHLTPSLIAERAEFYLTERLDLLLPLVITVGWAWLSHNPYVLIGYVAFIPWFLLNASAHSDAAGRLFTYYAYPFIVSLFFVLIGVLLQHQERSRPVSAKPAIAAFAAVALSSTAGFALARANKLERLTENFAPLPDSVQVDVIRQFREVLERESPVFGPVTVTPNVAALAPNAFLPEQVLRLADNGEIYTDGVSRTIDTVIYYRRARNDHDAIRLANQLGLPYFYRVRGSELRIFSRRSLHQMIELEDIVVPVSQRPVLKN